MSRYKVSGPISADEKVNLCERVMWKVSLCGKSVDEKSVFL